MQYCVLAQTFSSSDRFAHNRTEVGPVSLPSVQVWISLISVVFIYAIYMSFIINGVEGRAQVTPHSVFLRKMSILVIILRKVG